MTASELLKSKWYRLLIVKKLMCLFSQKYNKLVIVDLHYLMIITIILSRIAHFSFVIHSSSFAVSVLIL